MTNFTCPNCHEENAYVESEDNYCRYFLCPECDFQWEEENGISLELIKLDEYTKGLVLAFLNELIQIGETNLLNSKLIYTLKKSIADLNSDLSGEYIDTWSLVFTNIESRYSKSIHFSKGKFELEKVRISTESNDDGENINIYPPKKLKSYLDCKHKNDEFIQSLKFDILNIKGDISFFDDQGGDYLFYK